MAGPFYQFEVEHIFGQRIFDKNDVRAAILRQYGYTKEMASNKIALFKDADVVAQINDADDSHAFKQWLRDSGWGPVRHDGSFDCVKSSILASNDNEWIFWGQAA
jgi:hypothetical protein